MQGTVKWFDKVKGYGFISSAQGDVFVHFKEVKTIVNGRADLADGQKVNFEIEEGAKGMQAVNVTVL
ncbi:MAG: cold shock domain-containing protein [Romboutsia sp.]